MLFKRITDKALAEQLIQSLNERDKPVSLDTETTSKDPHIAELIDWQITGSDCDAVNLPAGLVGTLEKLRVPIILHNFKYDHNVLLRYGVDINKFKIYDTMFLSHLFNETRDSHSLESWTKELWQDDYKERFWAKYQSYLDATPDERLDYSCRDIVYTSLLFDYLSSELKKQGIPQELIEQQVEFAKILAETEYRGIKVDIPYTMELGVKLKTQIESLLPRMRESAKFEIGDLELEMWIKKLEERKSKKGKLNVKKPEFNFDSSKQLCNLLYSPDYLGLPEQISEKSRAVSADDASLEKIKELHPLIPLIQEYRGINKVYGSFIEGTLERVKDDRIFPTFNVIGTLTGRTSSSNPNLQQLPSEGGVRGIYVPDPGCCFISADYSQLEVCIEAHYTRDTNLLRVINEGLSKHDITARELGIDRATAKTLNFALQYWCSHYKVAKILGISNSEGLKVYNRYWDIYSGSRALKEKTDADVRSGNPIISIFGRKRRFLSTTRPAWSGDYRQAYNFLIQGSGADITNFALTTTHNRLHKSGSMGLFVVHDEVIAQVKKEYVEEARQIIKEEMEGMGKKAGLTVPLKVEVSEGMDRWLD